MIHPDDRKEAERVINTWLKKKEGTYDNNFRLRTKKGDYIWVRSTGKAVEYDAEGKVIRMIGNHTDITSIKKFQQELIKAKEEAEEANRLKTEFLKNMSHEVRTPMNGIIGFADMLDDDNLTNERRKYFSKIIQNSSHQLLRIINDILEISTLETKQISLIQETINLNDFLMEIFSVFNLKFKERNIPIYLRKGMRDNECEIVSDKTKLNKILSNLIENALKFTSEGFVETGYYIEAGKLVLYVKDTGMGISPQKQDLIFERFSQEDQEIAQNHGGLGLGLSIAKENAQLLGGDITLESVKGVGSTFFVSIPFTSKQENIKLEENINELSQSNNHVTILVVEDEEINYLYLETLFEEEKKYKFNVLHAKNGKEAIDLCQENENIDIVLMDLKMPVMNGFEASKIIKEKRPDLPIIAQTAYSTHSDKSLALNNGCDDFISKPIDRDKFFQLVYKHLKITH
ncbi:MAG: response regulator, partial [Bacteroidales bacterium]|nr:response regulator [Bacteroidales bacterium]